jgi:hypothetical protein
MGKTIYKYLLNVYFNEKKYIASQVLSHCTLWQEYLADTGLRKLMLPAAIFKSMVVFLDAQFWTLLSSPPPPPFQRDAQSWSFRTIYGT